MAEGAWWWCPLSHCWWTQMWRAGMGTKLQPWCLFVSLDFGPYLSTGRLRTLPARTGSTQQYLYNAEQQNSPTCTPLSHWPRGHDLDVTCREHGAQLPLAFLCRWTLDCVCHTGRLRTLLARELDPSRLKKVTTEGWSENMHDNYRIRICAGKSQ